MKSLTEAQKRVYDAIVVEYEEAIEKERRRWGEASAMEVANKGIPYTAARNDTLRALEKKGWIKITAIKHHMSSRLRKGSFGRLAGGTQQEYGGATYTVIPIVPKRNPSSPGGLRKAERLYETFHQFEPVKVGRFHRSFKIPKQATYVGEAKTMYYTSDKLNPSTGADEGYMRYYHPHEGGVRMYLTDKSVPGERRNIPPWIHQVDALVLIGQCDGFDYENFDGDVQEAKAKGTKPEWYCIPSGKALLVVQDKKDVLAIVWGGKLDVEWRGVVG